MPFWRAYLQCHLTSRSRSGTEAGFTDVTVKQVEGDPFNNCYIAKKH